VSKSPSRRRHAGSVFRADLRFSRRGLLSNLPRHGARHGGGGEHLASRWGPPPPPPLAHDPRPALSSARPQTVPRAVPELPGRFDLRAPWIAPAALAAALVSLALNGVLLWKLSRPERLAAPAVERALGRLAESDARLKYEVRVPAGTPLHFDVPVDERYVVKLRASLPIDTEVRVPLRTPFGVRTVEVPIKTTIPVRTDLPVHITDTFRLRTETKTEYVVPLEVRVRDLPLQEISESLSP
jgi:hypothetical protein